jgi:predicted alpha/beta hydrolase
MVLYDWPCIVGAVSKLFPGAPKVILGHSLGGQLTPMYLVEHPGEIDRLVMVAAPSLYWLDWPFPQSVGLLVGTCVFPMVARILGSFPGRRLGVGGTEAMGLMSDWGRLVRGGAYNMIRAGEDYVAAVRGLRIPLLAISFSDDGFAPQHAVDRYCERMSEASLTRWHLTPGDLGCDSLGHFHWVQQSEALADRIAPWLRGA